MPSVLFVCTANRFRSPLAAAFFQKERKQTHPPDEWTVDSAGTWAIAGLPVLPEVTLIARQYHLDLSRHRSKPVTEKLLDAHHLILVMEAGQQEALQNEFPAIRERVYLLSQVAEGRAYNIPDWIDTPGAILKISETLHELVQKGFLNICSLALRLQNERAGTAANLP
jgi:protein-tyrosine-phosphatase